MRLRGFDVSPILSPGSGGDNGPTSPVLSDIPGEELQAEGSGKAKGKAKATAAGPLGEETPKHIPYLTAPIPALGAAAPQRPWRAMPTDAQGTRTALADRIRLLRDVDEMQCGSWPASSVGSTASGTPNSAG